MTTSDVTPSDADLARLGVKRTQYKLASNLFASGQHTIEHISGRTAISKKTLTTMRKHGWFGDVKTKRDTDKAKTVAEWRTAIFESLASDGMPTTFFDHPGRTVRIPNIEAFIDRVLSCTPEEMEAMLAFRTADGRGLSLRVQAYVRLALDTISWDPKTRSAAMDKLIKITHAPQTQRIVFDTDPFQGLIDPTKARFRVLA